ncbi:hypothetical protein L1049_000671 [Liquidambar formosana]|uniref:Stigma-specific STIG1-like protein 1 n=1 Tax=Liquidambar formosana TaxID=63359 RepID=A0AAP0R7W4_LIQFO
MTMEVMKMIFTIAIFMALTITLITMKNIEEAEEKPPFKLIDTSDTWSKEVPLHDKNLMPSKRVSRFLAGNENPRGRNPNASDHCNKDNEICHPEQGRNSTICCNNKCIDVKYDKNNCGACKKKKCEYTDDCCGGECVNLAYDKRHCGSCHNKCQIGEYCIYGMCDYP